MKDWKTTAAGMVSAFFAFVLFEPELFASIPAIEAVAKFALVGGLGWLGISARDYRRRN